MTLAALFCKACSLLSSVSPQCPHTVLQYLNCGSMIVLYSISRYSFGNEFLILSMAPHVNCSSRKTSIYSTFFVLLIHLSPTRSAIRFVMSFRRFELPNNMNLVFSVFKLSLVAFNHWMTFSNSGISSSFTSPHDVICLGRFVSSAYIFISYLQHY